MNTAEIFAGLKNAQIFERGIFLEPGGKFKLRLKKTLIKNTQRSGLAFIAEYEVLESTHPKHATGTNVTWFQKLADKNVAFGALKEWAYAHLGYDYPDDKAMLEKKIDPQLEDIISEAVTKNSLVNALVFCETGSKKTQRGTDFTIHKWSPAK